MEIAEEFPSFKIIPKSESALMKALNIFLKIVTFGKMKTFMSHFTTVVGCKVYVPSNWEDFNKKSILRHERVHMRQAKRVGRIWFSIAYVMLWFPIGLAYFRMKWEQEAYEETMRFVAERKGGMAMLEHDGYRERMVKRFTGHKYVWTWPFRKSVEKWYDETVAKIKQEGEHPA
jgi:hypothetical protein